MDLVALPPTMDCAPEFCFCGRKTVESHEFWYCSTECARQDSLRSLDNPECHYRNVVQAYVRGDGPEPQPRRMVSADHMRSFANAPPPFVPPMNPPQHNAPFAPRAPCERNMLGYPTLSQVTGKILSKKASAGESLRATAERHDRPRWEGLSNAHPSQGSSDPTFQQISLDAIPLPEHVPARPLRRVPSSIGGLRNNTGKPSVAKLLNFGRSRKATEGEISERVFGHPVNPIIPPVRKESLPSHHQVNTPSATLAQSTKALRRSVSFNGWNATARDPRDEQDSLMNIIEEMREEFSECFDPRSLFNQEGDC